MSDSQDSKWSRAIDLAAREWLTNASNSIVLRENDSRDQVLADIGRHLSSEDASAPQDFLGISGEDVDQFIGCAIGRQFPGHLTEDALDVVLFLVKLFPLSQGSFKCMAASAFLKTPDAAVVLVNILRKRLSSSIEGQFAKWRANAIMSTNKIAWLGETELPFRAWSPAVSHHLFVDDWVFYDLLRKVNIRAFLDLFERVEAPDEVRYIVDLLFENLTINDLTPILEDAARAFSSEGMWMNGRVIPFAILSRCTCDLLAIHPIFQSDDKEPNDPRVVRHARQNLLSVLHALESRADFAPLGYSWLQYLIWFGRNRLQALNWRRALLFQMISTISKRLPIHANGAMWIASESDVWRNDRLYAVLAVLHKKQTPLDASMPSKEAIDFLERAINDDFVESFGATNAIVTTDSPEHCIVGEIVASAIDPIQWLSNLWEKTFHLRCRARIGARTQDGHTKANVSQVIIVWAILGCNQLKRDDMTIASGLWNLINRFTQEGMLTDGTRHPSDGWAAILSWLANNFLRLRFNDESDEGLNHLNQFISFWAEPSAEFASLICQLWISGVTADQFRQAIQSTTLLRCGATESRTLKMLPGHIDISALAIQIADEIDG